MRTEPQSKAISWAYPTSPNAKRFGYNYTGCYTVGLGRANLAGKPHKALKAFTTWDAAKVYADSLAEPWDKYTMSKPEHCQ